MNAIRNAQVGIVLGVGLLFFTAPANAGKFVDHFLAELIEIPKVTEADVLLLQRNLDARGKGERTFIHPLPKFKASLTKTPIGLYLEVMHRFPRLDRPDFNFQDKAKVIFKWILNLDLPVTFTLSREDEAFTQKLSQITGRHFRVMSEAENEYSIRGREIVQGKPTGPIGASTYFFGEGEDQVRHHAFVYENPLTQRRTHGVHEIPEGQDALYKNSFGLIHPIGNVFVRSQGVVRGGAYSANEWAAQSSFRDEGYAEERAADVGFRIAEEL